MTWDDSLRVPCVQILVSVRNDNLDTPESQSTGPESNPEQNSSQNASSKEYESNSPLPIGKVVTNLPGFKPLTTLQGFANKLLVRDARSFSKVLILDTGGLLGEMHEFPNESFLNSPKAQEVILNLKGHLMPESPNRNI
ncbi:hypothetical protein DSO57_1011323 [Entomophthora muscae]|uniref:Uncharacterized protein n=1 Tax=Entomophthora muscae TaxID=34485 RepID=A0ACC2T669_9FUNG|nr:hypothetical protein DSO57_1011323 [Entomophthora muscae]